MDAAQSHERRRRWSASGALALLAVIAALHVGAPLFVPVALAIIVAFILAPVTGWLQRRVGNVIAVTLVVVATWACLGALTWGVTRQVITFARELPAYREQLRQRVGELRSLTREPAVDQIESTLSELVRELEPTKKPDAPVVVVQPPPRAMLSISTLVRIGASAGLVTLLVFFLLLERQALRNRIVRLAGRGRVAMTTRALEEASRRISRYLVTHAALNVTFGIAAGLGLALLGLPYALGWGVLAAILKFVPFVGFWAAMAPPVLFSAATAAGWWQPGLVAGLYCLLAVASTFLLEPVLHAQALGVSRVALVLGLAFWAWLWGPVGLVIATPLTVCLIVLGRHVRDLRYLAVMIGDDAALQPHLAVYQRLLAGDDAEAMDLVSSARSARSITAVIDEVILPAAAVAKADHVRGEVSDEDVGALARGFARVLREIEAREAVPPVAARPSVLVVGCPAEDEFDHVALLALDAVDVPGMALDIVSPELLSSEVVSRVVERDAAIVCLAAIAPGGVLQIRYLTKRLRQHAPRARVVVLLFGGSDADCATLTAGGVECATTVSDLRDRLAAMIQLTAAPALAS
jgi:predicted PurR-regulated permease PerM